MGQRELLAASAGFTQRCPHCGVECDVIRHAMDAIERNKIPWRKPQPLADDYTVGTDGQIKFVQYRDPVVHVQHSIDCNVRHEEQRAKERGLVMCDHNLALEHACAQLRVECVVTARASWHRTDANQVMFVPHDVLRAALSVKVPPIPTPADVTDIIDRAERERRIRMHQHAVRVALFVRAIRSAKGTTPEELDAALVLIALGESLDILDDTQEDK